MELWSIPREYLSECVRLVVLVVGSIMRTVECESIDVSCEVDVLAV